MDKSILKSYVYDLLNQIENEMDLESIGCLESIDFYLVNTVIRLKKTYLLYLNDTKFLKDFLIALREYLLVFNEQLEINSVFIPIPNQFGIMKDDSNQFYCKMQLPNYINSNLIEPAFMNGGSKVKIINPKSKQPCLLTDPKIYKLTNYKYFKSEQQKLCVYSALNTPEGYTTLLSMPTGGGKSLITQTLAYQKDGLTIVVVPTVSLAIDQERAAINRIKRLTKDEEIFYYSGGKDSRPILNAIKNKKAKLLFLSPETLLLNQGFIEEINKANQTKYLRNIVIDEAHIVMDWGTLFRVDYQCLESWKNNLQATNTTLRTFLLSATFEENTVKLLKNMFSKDDKWIEVRCDTLRKEPRFVYVDARGFIDKKRKSLELIKVLPHPMIVYVSRPIEAEQLKIELQQEGIYNTRTFTGNTKSSERENLIEQWKNNEFEIMIATSAFGVGVDKSDVRTVLHLYLPQNANTYYQELGRGGRDGLPCISCMCIYFNSDEESSRTRITKQILTADKIKKRWFSILESPLTKTEKNILHIDTSVTPSYSEDQSDEDINVANMKWNVYVLLLFRRSGLIKIVSVNRYNEKYIFSIQILDSDLYEETEILIKKIENIHDHEYEYRMNGYYMLRNTVKRSTQRCWSEMFYETYPLVDEFCAGCNYDAQPMNFHVRNYTKKKIKKPIKSTSINSSLLGNRKEAVIIGNTNSDIYDSLIKDGMNLLVIDDENELLNKEFMDQKLDSIMIINFDEFFMLMSKENYFYTSGLIGFKYFGSEKKILERFVKVENYLNKYNIFKAFHIIDNDIYFSQQNKYLTELIDGPVYDHGKL